MALKQISVFLENRKGRLADLTRILSENKVNIKALSLADTQDFGMLRIIVDDPDRCLQILRTNGFVVQETEVIGVEVEDRPGGLSKILDILGKNNLNIEYIYATVERKQDSAIVIFKVEQKEATEKALRSAGVSLAGDEVLKNF
jgi:hypothetical protein